MKNGLLDNGIVLPSGESGRDKINLVAGGNHAAIDRLSFGSLGQRLSTIFWPLLAIASKGRYNTEKN